MSTITKWGPAAGVDSKDYLLMMEGDGGPTSRPQSLLGHALTSPNQNLTDALNLTDVILKNGRIQTISRPKRAAQETSRTYTIGFPSALMTPLMARVLQNPCPRTIYMKYLCPEDTQFSHAHVFPEATINPPIEAEDLVTTGDETNFITHTSEMQVAQKFTLWKLGYNKIFTEDADISLWDVVFTSDECAGCEFTPGQSMAAVGGLAGAADEEVGYVTGDRFATTTAMTLGIATGSAAVSIFADGDLVLVGFADTVDPATAVSGGLKISVDGGLNFAAVSGISVPIYAVVRLNQAIVAVGGVGAGPGAAFVSTDDGATWTEVDSTALPASDALLDAAVDAENSRIYIVGEAGTLLTGVFTGSSLQLTDLESNLPGSPGALYAVAVFAKGHLAVGGAAGYYAESKNSGVDWSEPDVPGTALIRTIAGNEHRQVVGAGAVLYERSAALSNGLYQAVTIESGVTITGDYTKVRMGLDGDMNLFVAVTDDGEVVFGKPYHPWA